MTVIPFRRPDNPPPDNEEPILYLTLYPSSTVVTSIDETPPDLTLIANSVFDSAFNILADTDECIALISLGAEHAMTFREPNSFDTERDRRWLRERLDYVYHNFTGRHRNPFRTFLDRLFPSKGDDQ